MSRYSCRKSSVLALAEGDEGDPHKLAMSVDFTANCRTWPLSHSGGEAERSSDTRGDRKPDDLRRAIATVSTPPVVRQVRKDARIGEVY